MLTLKNAQILNKFLIIKSHKNPKNYLQVRFLALLSIIQEQRILKDQNLNQEKLFAKINYQNNYKAKVSPQIFIKLRKMILKMIKLKISFKIPMIIKIKPKIIQKN